MVAAVAMLLILQAQPAPAQDATAPQAGTEPKVVEPAQLDEGGAPPPPPPPGRRPPKQYGPEVRGLMPGAIPRRPGPAGRPMPPKWGPDIPRVTWNYRQPFDPSTYGVGTAQMWEDYFTGRRYKRYAAYSILGSLGILLAGAGVTMATDEPGYLVGGSIASVAVMIAGLYFGIVGNRLIQDSTLHILMSTQPGGGRLPMGPGPMMGPPPPMPGAGAGVM